VTWRAGSAGDSFVDVHGVPFLEAIRLTVTNDAGLPCNVEMEARMRRGRYEVNQFVCLRKKGGPEITSEVIRRLPVGDLLRFAALNANSLWASPYADPEKIRAQGPTDESLRVVAQVYRMAIAARDDPTAAVASGLQLPRPTAARWVKTARQRGFLGPTEERRAGERKRR